eukprot:jgi/Mesvir1/28031/Mv04637-RA.1
MVVRLRLARFGRRYFPFYRIFAADARAPRDGKHLEVLGHYNPIPEPDGKKHMALHHDRVKYWLSVGAQPTDTVAYLLSRAGLYPTPPLPQWPNKGKPKAEKVAAAKAAAAKTPAAKTAAKK